MGPYYRGTSNGIGAFFDLFYQHPVLMLLVAAGLVFLGYSVWRKRKSEEIGH